VDFGVRKFEEAMAASDARVKRSARRGNRRKKWRLQQLKEAFYDFGLLEGELKGVEKGTPVFKEGYLAFTANHKTGKLDHSLKELQDRSVYHLRKRALKEEVSTRELLIAIYNICKTRGHFLLENIDFTKGSIQFRDFEEQFYGLSDKFVTILNKNEFSKEVLEPMFLKKLQRKEIKNLLKKQYVDCTTDEVAQERLINFVNLTQGFKGDLVKISKEAMLEDKPKDSVNVLELKKKDQLNEFLERVVSLSDMLETARILQEYDYICEKHAAEIDRVMDVLEKLKLEDSEQYEKQKKEIQARMKIKDEKIGEHLKVVKNIQNNYPNGLYQKEIEDILKKQSEYNDKITAEFIEVCKMIVRARIPYYMGPLSAKAKNSWISRKDGKIKYSYEYAAKQNFFDVPSSVRKWKEAMISRCTYLPQEYALPKGSFSSDLFNILNEINILKANSADTYYLTREDKIKVINELFLKKKEVTFKDVQDILGLEYFGTASNPRKKFNTAFSMYHDIVKCAPEYRISDISDALKNRDKIDMLDDVILSLNLYDDEKSKFDYFQNTVGITDESTARQLAKLNCTGFTALSKKFIFETPMDDNRQSLIEKLFENNTEEYTNEQNTLIQNAYNEDGEKYEYNSNKYGPLLEKNSELGIHLLMDENKPFVPIARPVVRGLNETFKVYSSIIDTYGFPERVVIETARELKDSKRNGEEPAKHFAAMSKCIEHLKDQCKEKKVAYSLDEDEVVLSFLEKNAKKVELYIRQNGVCMISGKKIDLNSLHNYEIDHVLPRGFGDNSMNNLILIEREINSAKGDKLPLEFLRGNQGKYSESDYEKRAKNMFEMKLISEEKFKRLLLENQDDALGFVQRNLVDTRYIIKEFTSILSAFHKIKNQSITIISLQGGYNGIYRKAFRMSKNRDIGDQHHAHDAAIIIVVDKVLNYICPNYHARPDMRIYREKLMGVRKEEAKAKEDYSKAKKPFDSSLYFINTMYRKAFNLDEGGKDFLAQVKKRVPLYSLKVNRKHTGELFDATIYPQDNTRKEGVLDLIGVNSETKVFSSINCVAVDFYKVTTEEGKKKHCAVHIPKAIVDANGNINEELYLKLVNDHYDYKELIGEDGKLNEGYFRLRMFKGDLFYDTERRQPMIFELGSIANQKLKTSPLNIFSYQELNEIKEAVVKKYEKLDKNEQKDGKILQSLIIEDDEFQLSEVSDKQRQNFVGQINDVFKREQNASRAFFKALDQASFLKLVLGNKLLPPTITGQNKPTINQIKGADAQYVKITTSPLGFRYTLNDGNLAISGPRDFKKNNKFKLIKKEKFSWTI
ncbi:MAG: type II CRISPR RNA-guided endonuclease Cas9, partial [Anaerorhabdus sp.]